MVHFEFTPRKPKKDPNFVSGMQSVYEGTSRGKLKGKMEDFDYADVVQEGTMKCKICGQEHPASSKYFLKRRVNGQLQLMDLCRSCASSQKRNEYRFSNDYDEIERLSDLSDSFIHRDHQHKKDILKCASCKKMFNREKMTDRKGKTLCPKCLESTLKYIRLLEFKKNYQFHINTDGPIYCYKCGGRFETEKLEYYNKRYFCEKCFSDDMKRVIHKKKNGNH